MINKRDAEATELAKKTAGHESVRLFETVKKPEILLRSRRGGNLPPAQ